MKGSATDIPVWRKPHPQPLRGANIGFADIIPIAMERGADSPPPLPIAMETGWRWGQFSRNCLKVRGV